MFRTFRCNRSLLSALIAILESHHRLALQITSLLLNHGPEPALPASLPPCNGAGINDLRRCKQITATWGIDVKDESCRDYDKRTPMHVAASEGAFSVVQWLVEEAGANLNPLDRWTKTPLEVRAL